MSNWTTPQQGLLRSLLTQQQPATSPETSAAELRYYGYETPEGDRQAARTQAEARDARLLRAVPDAMAS